MKGLLFATILLSSAALLTSGDIDVEAAIRREALSYGTDGELIPRSRGDVRVDEDLDKSIALPFLIAARRRRQNDGRPRLIVSHSRDPLNPLNRIIMGSPMYVDEPGFMDITQTKGNNLRNRLQSGDFPIIRGKKIRSSWSTNVEKQNDHRVRMRKREMKPQILDPADFVIPKGKRYYLVDAEELSKKMVPSNDDDGDGDSTMAKSLESIEQTDHFARRSTRSKQRLTLWDRMNASTLFHPQKGKRTSRPTVYRSPGSV